jgi:hypothetical protein
MFKIFSQYAKISHTRNTLKQTVIYWYIHIRANIFVDKNEFIKVYAFVTFLKDALKKFINLCSVINFHLHYLNSVHFCFLYIMKWYAISLKIKKWNMFYKLMDLFLLNAFIAIKIIAFESYMHPLFFWAHHCSEKESYKFIVFNSRITIWIYLLTNSLAYKFW